ncbi:MAG TPA: TonB family protein [Bryobacteraceae bacterium]|jgi:protein TonB|nr:TonB family protein [Bryobacteraceae bacterium]
MFEQAVLPSRPAGGRYWTVAAGFTGELVAVGLLLLAPLVWTDFLPRARALNWISLPAPPPPVVKETPPPPAVHPTHPWQSEGRTLTQPRLIPPTALMFEDPPGSEPSTSANGGVQGIPGGVLTLFDSSVPPVGPEHHVTQTVTPPAPTPRAAPRRISALHPARRLHRVDPAYPAIARAARISGTVELTGVIATDGRIRELRVVSGNPFLAQAALDAVRQWIYEPTGLNGEPVEVVAPITVYFHLN